jgi:hypothetical protein
MHDRHSATSCRVTEPAGNPPKSSTSCLAAFGAFAFAGRAFDFEAAFAALVARAFGFASDGAGFAAPFFDFAAAAFFAADSFGAPPFFAFDGAGFAFFAAAFGLLLVGAIIVED